ncbi:hypothetical protein [Bacillus niameyensis]|nr:hypothetical protein [Bacillus niameyensis]
MKFHFICCILLGVGLGFLFDQIPAGALIGVGAGFLLMGIIGKRK